MLKQQRVICFPGRPAAGLAVSFTAGTFAGLQLHSVFVSTVVLIAVSAAALILLRLGRRYRIAFNAAVAATHALVASAACFSAAIAIAGRTRDYSPLWEMLAADERVSISGTVITEPYGQRFERGGACVSFTLKVKSIPDDFGGVNPNPFNLQVECFGPPSILGDNPSRPMPRGGEGWCFTGRLRKKKLPNLGESVIKMSVSPGGWIQDPDFDSGPFILKTWDIRRAAAAQLAAGIENYPETVSVLRAMLLGYRGDMPYDLKNLFADSGIMHILAISGMHVGIIVLFLTTVLPSLRIRRNNWGWLVCPAIVVYTYLTGCRPSAQRACIMTLIAFSAPAFKRKPDSIAALASTLLAMLAVSPFQLEDLGFILSFTCVAGILVITPVLLCIFRKENKSGNDAPEEPEEDIYGRLVALSREKTKLNRVKEFTSKFGLIIRNFIGDSISVSLAAWLVSTPLTAVYFGKISPAGIFNNLFAVFLAGLIVVSGCLSLLCSLFSQWLSVTFNCASVGLVKTLIRLTEATDGIKGSSFETAPWSACDVIAWYLAVFAVTLAVYIRLHRKPDEIDVLF